MEGNEEGHTHPDLRAGLGFGTSVSADISKVRLSSELSPGQSRGPKSMTAVPMGERLTEAPGAGARQRQREGGVGLVAGELPEPQGWDSRRSLFPGASR